MEQEHENKLHLTILVNGNPEQKEYPPATKVAEVIRDLLPESEKKQADQFQLIDRNISATAPLDPQKSLAENGVKSGHTLSLTKKDGGGGAAN